MRIDEWVVQKKYLNSRNKANRFIREHGIMINGKKITKPSYRVRLDDNVEIDHETIKKYRKPLGFQKLKLLASDPRFPAIKSNDLCLDIGSSVGGFSLFMLENGAKYVHAIEISRNFEPELKRLENKWPNFSYNIANYFELNEKNLIGLFTLITADLTLDPNYLIQNFYLFLKFLNFNTRPLRILTTIKTGKINDLEEIKNTIELYIRKFFPNFSKYWLNSQEEKREIFLLLVLK